MSYNEPDPLHFSYRRDIDGLRAIAVVAVILFHLNLGILPGGFVGVDIFFVISGFLITGNIIREIKQGQFSLVKFYIRRIRRIFPALFVVLLASLVVACLIFTDLGLIGFANQLKYAALQISNFFFQRELGYFEHSNHGSVLLHTWSLGVEEQFYVLWPFLIWLFFKKGKNRVLSDNLAFSVLLFLIVASLSTSQILLYTNVKVAFYSLPSRLFELGIGAVLSFNRIRNFSKKGNEALGILGLLLIAISFFVIKQTYFPGVVALIPCVGAALIIFSGQNNSLISRLLSKKPLVFIGLISYSLYLWHYPIIVFYQEYTGRNGLSFLSVIFIALATLSLSYLSWRFIEVPFRNKKNLDQEALLFQIMADKKIPIGKKIKIFFYNPIIVALICSALLLLVSANIKRNNGWLWRFPKNTIASDPNISKYSTFGNLEFCITSRGSKKYANIKDCTIGPNKDKFEVAVFGDSHGGHYSNSVLLWASNNHLTTFSFTVHACSLLFPIKEYNNHDKCVNHFERAREILRTRQHIKYVFIANRWGATVNLDDQSSVAEFKQKLEKTIKEITARGKKVIILGEVPSFAGNDKGDGPTECIRHNFVPFQKIIPNVNLHCTESSRDKMLQVKLNQFIGSLVSKYENAAFFDPTNYFCDKKWCYASRDGKILYSDSNHLNVYGSDYIGEYIKLRSF